MSQVIPNRKFGGSSSGVLERGVWPDKRGLHWALVLSAREQSLISLFTNLDMDPMTIFRNIALSKQESQSFLSCPTVDVLTKQAGKPMDNTGQDCISVL